MKFNPVRCLIIIALSTLLSSGVYGVSSTQPDILNSISTTNPGISIATLAEQNNAGQHAYLVQIDYAAFDGPKSELFADTATLFELTSYRIHTDRLLDFRVEDYQLTITNWVPRNLSNVLIVANYAGEQFPVTSIDHLPGLQRVTMPLPWNFGASQFLSTQGNVVDFANVDPAEVSFGFLPQDDVQQAIADIKVQWQLDWPDRVMLGKSKVCRPFSVVWRPTRPQDGRYTLAFLIRAAQVVSHPKFYEFWMKTAFIDSKGRIKKAEDVMNIEEFEALSDQEKTQYDLTALYEGKYYNKAHRQKTFDKYWKKRFAMGMTGGGGLGGGATVGVNHTPIFENAWNYSEGAAAAFARDEWFLTDKTENRGTPWNIFGHEAGHALGFGHSSSYTVRRSNSHITVGNIVYSWLVKSGQAIVTADTMVGRDLSWEEKYGRKKYRDSVGPARISRPECGSAFEWGGAYERHALMLPEKGSDQWYEYLEAHRQGTGLDYLRSITPDVAQ